MLCCREGNRRPGVALVMRRRYVKTRALCCVVRSFVVEARPVVVVIRALYSHLSRRHDDGDATSPAALRRGHVVTIRLPPTDRMNRPLDLRADNRSHFVNHDHGCRIGF